MIKFVVRGFVTRPSRYLFVCYAQSPFIVPPDSDKYASD